MHETFRSACLPKTLKRRHCDHQWISFLSIIEPIYVQQYSNVTAALITFFNTVGVSYNREMAVYDNKNNRLHSVKSPGYHISSIRFLLQPLFVFLHVCFCLATMIILVQRGCATPS